METTQTVALVFPVLLSLLLLVMLLLCCLYCYWRCQHKQLPIGRPEPRVIVLQNRSRIPVDGSESPPPEYQIELMAPPPYSDLYFASEVVIGQMSPPAYESESDLSHSVGPAGPRGFQV